MVDGGGGSWKYLRVLMNKSKIPYLHEDRIRLVAELLATAIQRASRCENPPYPSSAEVLVTPSLAISPETSLSVLVPAGEERESDGDR